MQVELVIGNFERMVGQAWYAMALQKYLTRLGVDFITTPIKYPMMISTFHTLFKPLGYDLKSFFATYPVSAKTHNGTIKHFTTQQMASLLSFQTVRAPVIITVHDIIPFMHRYDPELTDYHRLSDRQMDTLAIKNLRKADFIITDAEYTRAQLTKELGISPEKIKTVLLGLDLDVFRPIKLDEIFKEKYKIDESCRYILYVGSELPRKNLHRLLEAFAIVRSKYPNVKLIKIGTPSQLGYTKKLQDHIQTLNLQEDVILQNHVPLNDLILFYNLADVFVFPSICEGFGLPPLEAMACGAPVICSNATSLPEVVGEAALSVDPHDIDGWANAIELVLEDRKLQHELRTKSLKQASRFSWERMARETVAVYSQVSNLHN